MTKRGGERLELSLVEEALRGQRESWREIVGSSLQSFARGFPSTLPSRIILFGVGSSHFAARLLAYSLARERNGRRIPVYACPSQEVGATLFPSREDWVFALSHRGRTPLTLRALELCRSAGAFTTLVAGQGVNSPEWVNLFLPTCALEKAEPHTQAVTGAICAITCALLGEPAAEEWRRFSETADPDLAVLRESVAGRVPNLLLGEWVGEWLAKEGALKLMEMARLPVRTFGSEEYFHGPHFSSAEKDRIWHVCVPGDPRVSEIQASHRFEISGDGILPWLPALVELQWMALAVGLVQAKSK